ncbi:neurogenic locus notch homolog protein 1-like [Xenopus laevis]|nr:neurogenic locus notch homolog protein 1-like [Xenopus laevis]
MGCTCPDGFSGSFCQNPSAPCRGEPCFPTVACATPTSKSQFICGKCPPGTVASGADGEKCFLNDLCLPPYPFPCSENANCISNIGSFSCLCKPGFTGTANNCSDIDECQTISACPNAKYECINSPGSFTCACRYQSTSDTECGDSSNPPGWNIFNCTLKWLTMDGNNLNPSSSANLYERLQSVLSLGFQNKFYSLQLKNSSLGDSYSEYRINVSSDTPHWFVKDYLIRVRNYYQFGAVWVEDVNECEFKENNCSDTAVCKNTYGGYKCVCDPNMKLEANNCVPNDRSQNETLTGTNSMEQNTLILGLVLGFGIPLILLLLLLICCYCSRRKDGKANIATAPDIMVAENIRASSLYANETVAVYKVHHIPPSTYAQRLGIQ